MEISINYLFLFMIIAIDILGLNKLWNERYSRRLLHHIQRGVYNPCKRPEYYLNQKMKKEHLSLLDSMESIENLNPKRRADIIHPLLSKLFNGNFSNKSTLNIKEFCQEDKEKLISIGKEYLPIFEKLIGKPLFLSENSDQCFILRYAGKDAQFPWHYDNEHSSCYRALFLFKKEGEIPDFLYVNEKGKKKVQKNELGDGIFFKGKYTYHKVNPSHDEKCRRYMITFQYTTKPNHYHKSLCSFFEQGIGIILQETKMNIGIYTYLNVITSYYFPKFLFEINPLLLFNLIVANFLILYVKNSTRFINNRLNINFIKIPFNILLVLKYYIILCCHSLAPFETLFYVLYILHTESLFLK